MRSHLAPHVELAFFAFCAFFCGHFNCRLWIAKTSIQDHELESRIPENRLSGLGGGRRPKAVLYQHQKKMRTLLSMTGISYCSGTGSCD